MSDFAFPAAACGLAREIFIARKHAYDLEDDWASLPKPIKDFYIKQAADILTANRPSNVVGRITPSEPYGVNYE